MFQEKNRITNIGIFAHVDAGKTTITENLLYECGVLKERGRVDNGNTQTDSLSQERERGISIQAAPVSFQIDDLKVNLIDTPGHVDFVAEVERTINILDGAILVLSAKEGLQAHTFLLFNSLKKLGIPVIFFINKIDRAGCCIGEVLEDIRMNLTRDILPIQQVFHEGTRESSVSEIFKFPDENHCDFLSDYDEKIFEKVINDRQIPKSQVRKSVICLSKEAKIFPLVFGSALKGIGIRELREGIKLFLPSSCESEENSHDVSWQVFKINRSPENIRQVYIKVFSGEVKLWDVFGTEKISKIRILKNGKTEVVSTLPAGEIGIIQGLKDCKINDFYGEIPHKESVKLGNPTLRYAIKPLCLSDKCKLLQGIGRIAESDPYLEYDLDESRGELYLNLFGSIQMEIIKDILLKDYSVEIEYKKPFVIYMETVKSKGKGFMPMFHNKDNPYNATLGIKVEPNEIGTGNIIESEISATLPKWFEKGAIDGIETYLRQGVKGWEITDTKITIIDADFIAVTTPADFRNLAPLVFFKALKEADTKLLWPLLKFEIKVPEKYNGKVIEDLMKMQAKIKDISVEKGSFKLIGTVPAEYFQNYQKSFSKYASGQSHLSSSFSTFEEVPRDIEKKGRKIYPDPLNITQYNMSKKGIAV